MIVKFVVLVLTLVATCVYANADLYSLPSTFINTVSDAITLSDGVLANSDAAGDYIIGTYHFDNVSTVSILRKNSSDYYETIKTVEYPEKVFCVLTNGKWFAVGFLVSSHFELFSLDLDDEMVSLGSVYDQVTAAKLRSDDCLVLFRVNSERVLNTYCHDANTTWTLRHQAPMPSGLGNSAIFQMEHDYIAVAEENDGKIQLLTRLEDASWTLETVTYNRSALIGLASLQDVAWNGNDTVLLSRAATNAGPSFLYLFQRIDGQFVLVNATEGTGETNQAGTFGWFLYPLDVNHFAVAVPLDTSVVGHRGSILVLQRQSTAWQFVLRINFLSGALAMTSRLPYMRADRGVLVAAMHVDRRASFAMLPQPYCFTLNSFSATCNNVTVDCLVGETPDISLMYSVDDLAQCGVPRIREQHIEYTGELTFKFTLERAGLSVQCSSVMECYVPAPNVTDHNLPIAAVPVVATVPKSQVSGSNIILPCHRLLLTILGFCVLRHVKVSAHQLLAMCLIGVVAVSSATELPRTMLRAASDRNPVERAFETSAAGSYVITLSATGASILTKNTTGTFQIVATVTGAYTNVYTNGQLFAVCDEFGFYPFTLNASNEAEWLPTIPVPCSLGLARMPARLLQDNTMVVADETKLKLHSYALNNDTWEVIDELLFSSPFTVMQLYDDHAVMADYGTISLLTRSNKSWVVQLTSEFSATDLLASDTLINVAWNGGDTVLLCSYLLNSEDPLGTVHLFTEVNGNISYVSTTRCGDLGFGSYGLFGSAILVVDDNTFLVAAPYADIGSNFDGGAVAILTRTDAQSPWTYIGQFRSAEERTLLGRQLVRTDDVLLILGCTYQTVDSFCMLFPIVSCFSSPLNVTCNDIQVASCNQAVNVSLSDMYTVHNLECGVPVLEVKSTVFNGNVTFDFELQRFTSQKSCRSVLSCTPELAPRAEQTVPVQVSPTATVPSVSTASLYSSAVAAWAAWLVMFSLYSY